MTASKAPLPKQSLRDALGPRVITEPEAYTRDELKALIHAGRRYGRGLMKARLATGAVEQAEAFRRKCEIIWIFRGLPEHQRRRPHGQTTKDEVLHRLEQIGIRVSERTLLRDYAALGGAEFLRGAKPFTEGEDRSSPCPTGPARQPLI